MPKEYRKQNSGPEASTLPVIELPPSAGIDENGYISEYTPQIRLTQNQRRGQRKLVNTLKAAAAELENGGLVDNTTRAIQWMLERVNSKL